MRRPLTGFRVGLIAAMRLGDQRRIGRQKRLDGVVVATGTERQSRSSLPKIDRELSRKAERLVVGFVGNMAAQSRGRQPDRALPLEVEGVPRVLERQHGKAAWRDEML